jgi:hypothetical protein
LRAPTHHCPAAVQRRVFAAGSLTHVSDISPQCPGRSSSSHFVRENRVAFTSIIVVAWPA